MSKRDKADIALALGLIGIIGAFITIISDVILTGIPVSAYSFLKHGTENMAEIAQWRITAGTFIGVAVLPFQIAGLMPLYRGLKPSGRVMPLIVVITDAHALIMGVAFHISYAFIGSGWRLHYKTGTGNAITSEIVTIFNSYWKAIIIILLVELLISSLFFSLLVMRGNTLYPKWMAALNPLFLSFYIFMITITLPAPVGGFIAPTFFNMTTMVFFITSTIIIYKRLKTA